MGWRSKALDFLGVIRAGAADFVNRGGGSREFVDSCPACNTFDCERKTKASSEWHDEESLRIGSVPVARYDPLLVILNRMSSSRALTQVIGTRALLDKRDISHGAADIA